MNSHAVIFDIDGTLACCKHRLHHILDKTPKDWDAFDAETHKDLPIWNVIKILWQFQQDPHFVIILLTGRNERNREATEKWLSDHYIPYDRLMMRALNDHRPANEIKPELLQNRFIVPDDVVTIFEDEPKTIQALRNLGYHVCDVGGWQDHYSPSLCTGGRDDDNTPKPGRDGEPV